MNHPGEKVRFLEKMQKMRTLVLCNLLIHTISIHKSRGPERNFPRRLLHVSIVLPGGQSGHARTAATTNFVTDATSSKLALGLPHRLRDPGSKAAAPILFRHSETWAGAVFQSCSCIESLCLPGSVPLFMGRPPSHARRKKVGSPFRA